MHGCDTAAWIALWPDKNLNPIYRQRFARSAIALFPGVKNGQVAGKTSNIVRNAVDVAGAPTNNIFDRAVLL